MQITVNSVALATELRLLNKIAPTKAALAILSHVLLRADDTLRCYATDLEVGLQTTCAATIHAPGIIALPAARFLAMVEQFPSADVVIQADGPHARISCGAFTSRVQTLPASDFPSTPVVEGVVSTMNGPQFRQMIMQTRYAITDANAKAILRGALLTLANGTGALAATDGRRVSLATMGRQGPEARVMIPVKTLDALMAQPETDTVTLTIGERHLFFQVGHRLIVSRQLEGEYPRFDRIIPQGCEHTAIVKRLPLMLALRRVGLVADDDKVARFQLSENALDISASSAAIGDAMERLTEDPQFGRLVQFTGGPLSLHCNWQHVLDFLDAASGESVSIAIKDARTPMLLTDGDHHLAVIMLVNPS